jgi:DNA polymerase-1
MSRLYYEIELPLSVVLAKMELAGVLIDAAVLDSLGVEFQRIIDEEIGKIYEMAGEEFNLNSPKQIGHILFEKLKLPPISKTKTGFSTSQEVLDILAGESEIVCRILSYRKYFKLLSTYVHGLKKEQSQDRRIHTIFLQTLTTTGRLSSIEPNVQNIPTRDPIGIQIKKAFVAPENTFLVSCDYSQIELRILALIADVSQLKIAFENGIDVHLQTAKYLFPNEADPYAKRGLAKTINFAVLYGQTPWGLARELGISATEAKEYIESFFQLYKEIEEYKKKMIRFASENGYVSTLFKRRRYLNEFKNMNFSVNKIGERYAVNTPIQGTAADVIKLAMVKIDKFLCENNLKTRLIMQIHDEIILEVPTEELEIIRNNIPDIMVNSAGLDIILQTSFKVGSSWHDLK